VKQFYNEKHAQRLIWLILGVITFNSHKSLVLLDSSIFYKIISFNRTPMPKDNIVTFKTNNLTPLKSRGKNIPNTLPSNLNPLSQHEAILSSAMLRRSLRVNIL